MTAIGKREELEAVVNRVLTQVWKRGIDDTSGGRPRPVDAILAAAETYANAAAGEAVAAALDSSIRIQREADRRARLVLGAAETYGRTA